MDKFTQSFHSTERMSTQMLPGFLLCSYLVFFVMLGMIVRPSKSSPNHTEICWVLQCDFGGALPTSLLNLAMPYAIKLFVTSLREGLFNVQLYVNISLFTPHSYTWSKWIMIFIFGRRSFLCPPLPCFNNLSAKKYQSSTVLIKRYIIIK